MIELQNPREYLPEDKTEYRLVQYEDDGRVWYAIEFKEKLFFGLFYRWMTFRSDEDDVMTWAKRDIAEKYLHQLRNPPKRAKKTIL